MIAEAAILVCGILIGRYGWPWVVKFVKWVGGLFTRGGMA